MDLYRLLKQAYNFGRDNGIGRSEKNLNDFIEKPEIKQLLISGVVSSDNKAVAQLHKLMVKYHKAGLELEKRKEAVIDVNDLNVIDLQIRTNKSFLEDIMQTAGALL